MKAEPRDIWVQTISGRKVSLIEPMPEQIDLTDIAHALSMICRFNGHIRQFYSVAEHSVFVSKIVPERYALVGLLHDAAEAYLGDVTRPAKWMMELAGSCAYQMAEARMWSAIAKRFAVNPADVCYVKNADNIALATEKRDLLSHDLEWNLPLPQPIGMVINPCGSPTDAMRQFVNRYNDLLPKRI